MSPGNSVGLKYGEKFNGTGYHGWQFKMKLSLIQQEVWYCVEPQKEEAKTSNEDAQDIQRKENLAYTFLMLSLSDSVQKVVRRCRTAKETWDLLKEKYGSQGAQERLEIREKLHSMKFKEGTRMIDHIAKMEEYVELLTASGGEVQDDELLLCLLRSLPRKYDTMKVMLRTRGKQVKLEELQGLLLVEERESEERFEDKESLYYARGRSTQSSSRRCFKCNKEGHISSTCKELRASDGRFLCRICQSRNHLEKGCPKRKSGNKSEERWNKSEKNNFLFHTSDVKITEKTEEKECADWLLDSGATRHLCNNINIVEGLKEDSSKVQIADGSYMDGAGAGIVSLRVVVNKSVHNVEIDNTLVTKALEKNILSVGKLTDKGAEVRFIENEAYVIMNGETVMEAKKKDGLYYVTLAKKADEANVSTAIEDQIKPNHDKAVNRWKGGDINVWHRRLGHIGEEALKKTVPIKGKLKLCEECLESKFDRTPFNENSEREKYVLERIYSDVCGPIGVESFGGSKYFVSFIDGFSRYAHVYTISNKSEVIKCFEDYCKIVENETGKKVRSIRSDNGGEYANVAMKDYCKNKGIRIELTTPYTSQQNGMAERYNRTILNMVRAMLRDAKLEMEFWAEAVRTAALLRNITASRVLNWKSPCEIWTTRKPKLGYLRTFGSIAYVRVPEPSRSKLDMRGKKVLFLGYDMSLKNYRVLDLEENRIIRSRDVRFIETEVYEESGSNDFRIEEENNILKPTDAVYQPSKKGQEVETSDDGVVVQYEIPSNDNNMEDQINWSDEIYQSWKNKTPVTTRSGRVSKLPARLKDYVNLGVTTVEIQEPNTYKEAIECNEQDQWRQSMKEELNNLVKNQTWNIVERPKYKNVVGCKWVYRLKKGPDGNINKYKSRLVAKGYSQRFGEDFNETYAPVGTYTTIRCLLALSACLNLKLYHFDFECAYLNGKLTEGEEIYMEIPQGFEVEKQNQVLKLRKCLYGLKQSGRSWNNELDRSLKELNLIQSKTDRCLYTNINGDNRTLVLVYVDDLAIASNDDEFVNNIKSGLMKKFVLKDLQDLNYFLGINIEHTSDSILINQKQFILKMLNQYGMQDCKTSSTPMEIYSSNNSEDTEDTVKIEESIPFRSAIGSLNYLAVISRPDIAYATHKLAQKVECPTTKDWIAVKRILRYLQGTKDLKLRYKRNHELNVEIFSDADYGGSDDRKSTSGYVVLVNKGAVAWASRKQACVALSTMESEYVALANASQEGLYLLQVLEDMGIKKSLEIAVDNQSCILFAKNECGPGKAKHISIKYYFVKDLVDQGTLKLKYVESLKNSADILTKSLSKDKHLKMVSQIGLCLNQ